MAQIIPKTAYTDLLLTQHDFSPCSLTLRPAP
jgi:hypothetical protein